jgi:hypothetical protein
MFDCVAEELEIGEVDTGKDVVDIRKKVGDAAIFVIAGIAQCWAFGGSGAEYSIDWF